MSFMSSSSVSAAALRDPLAGAEAAVDEQEAQADDQRADRGPEPLGQTHRHRVETARQLGERRPGGDVGVPEPGAVQVQSQAVLAGEILHRLWDSSHTADEHVCDVHVSNLRRKIEPDPKIPRFIVTILGEGYKFAAQVRANCSRPPALTTP